MAQAKARMIWRRPPEPPVFRNLVNISMSTGTYGDVIQETAKQRGWRVEWESAPDELRQTPLSHRGFAFFGEDVLILDRIAAEHKNLYWTVSDGVLRFDVRDARMNLSPFDELAGRLMHGAKRGPNGRILPEEYRRIATELDNRGFKPKDCLERRDRKALADWNKTHPRTAIHTFPEALEHRVLGWIEVIRGVPPKRRELSLRHAMLKRLSRALDKWNRAGIGVSSSRPI